MEMHKKIDVTIDEARELYDSGNKTLKDLALKVFSEDELNPFPYSEIKTFEDACNALYMSPPLVDRTIREISKTSRATVAMYKLNIIRKALNFKQDLHFTENPRNSYIYCPCNQLVAKNSTYYVNALCSDRIDVIGKIRCEESEYYVIGGEISAGNNSGLGSFYCSGKTGNAHISVSFLGCASYEIAKHFGKYFGMLITEAKFGDLPDFEIIEDKYGNT